MKHLFSDRSEGRTGAKRVAKATSSGGDEKDNVSCYLFKYKCVVTRDCEENAASWKTREEISALTGGSARGR